MKVLITGGAGYIGSHALVETLREGHDVMVVDDFSNSCPETLKRVQMLTNRAFGWVEADIRDALAMEVVLKDFQPDAVIHFAGLKAVEESGREPAKYYSVNVAGSLNLLSAMEKTGCTRLVFSSSATVYGEPRCLPIDEDHPLCATNPYGRSKLQVEDILRDQASARPDWSIAILRYFNPVGAHDSGLIGESPKGPPANLMPFVAQVAIGMRESLRIFGDDYPTPDGTGVRDYLHVIDLAKAHVSALRWSETHRGARAFNLGVGKGVSVIEMVRSFERASGRSIRTQVAPRRPGDVASCYADPSRAHSELGWRAERRLEDMCRSAWEWQKRGAAETGGS